VRPLLVQVGDPAAEAWSVESDPDSVAFEYEVL